MRKRKSGRAKVSASGADLWAHGYARAALERMMRIHRLIEDGEYPNCTTMSQEFEMSVRTLKRDIEFMKDRLEMPIQFDVPKNGYCFTRPVPHFPRVPLTEKEVVGLFVAQKTIAQYQGTSLQPVLDGAFRKMTAQLDDAVRFSLGNLDEVLSVRPLAPGDTELETFELLTRAVRERRAVRFTYRKHGQLARMRKHVHPYHIAYVNNQWTLFAFDPRQRDVRKFVLFRLVKPELTGERFTVSGKFDLNKELSGSLGVYKGGDDYEVVVDFDAWGADDVRGRRWHSSQRLTELPKGMLRVTLRLNSLEEVVGWVLSFGTHATVVAPEALRDRLLKATHELFGRYGEPMVIAGRDEG
jgi:proteasome accessory factor B